MKREALLRNFAESQNYGGDPLYLGAIQECRIALTKECEKNPQLGMDESC